MRVTDVQRRILSPSDITWASVILSVLCLCPVPADDWPQWRGPNRDGVYHESGVLESFPAEGLKVRWRVPVGWGFSSPVVANGRVIVTDAQLEKPNVRGQVLCFDRATGESLWTHSQVSAYDDWAFVAGQEPGPNSTPIINDGKVYALGPSGHRLFCLDFSSGKLLWEKNLAELYQIDSTTSISTSPLVEGKLLIVLLGGKPEAGVVAFDKVSGEEVWRCLDEYAAHSSPIIVNAGGKRQLIVWTLKSVYGLEPATGKPYWREPFIASGSSSVVATPVVSNNRLLVNGLMLKLDPERPAASVLWPEDRTKRILASTSTPLLLDNHFFCCESSGKLTCRDANTGQEVWTTDKATSPPYGTTACIHLTANGNSVLLFNDRGELIRARLTAEGYHEISRVALIEPTYPSSGRKVTWSAPAFANRHVFARNNKELLCASFEGKP